jgi:predicted N-acyltransferase
MFTNGADLTEELYDDLYEYYAFTKAEMPYGTAKARTGDPFEWVTERFESDVWA